MRDYFSSRGLGATRYISIGDGQTYLNSLSPKIGVRLLLEFCSLKTRKKNIAINPAISAIEDFLLEQEIEDWQGLFLDTSWYKESTIVGMAGSKELTFFFKNFKSEHASMEEAEKIKQTEQHYGNYFIVPEVISCTGNLLVTKFIPRDVTQPVRKKIILPRLAMASKQMELEQNCLLSGLLVDVVQSINLITGNQKVVLALEPLSAMAKYKCQTYPVCFSHGDFTPWNCFLNHDGNIVLVDCERAGFRSSFSDLIHYIAQPLVMNRFCSTGPKTLATKIAKLLGIQIEQSVAQCFLYLCEEIIIDTDEYQNRNHSQILSRALQRKINWLSYFASEFDHIHVLNMNLIHE